MPVGVHPSNFEVPHSEIINVVLARSVLCVTCGDVGTMCFVSGWMTRDPWSAFMPPCDGATAGSIADQSRNSVSRSQQSKLFSTASTIVVHCQNASHWRSICGACEVLHARENRLEWYRRYKYHWFGIQTLYESKLQSPRDVMIAAIQPRLRVHVRNCRELVG